ncbi:MAG: TIGR04283 family arsenosugar biosynthesis glycosyltransferase [Deltaproteobacteria bacterium]|jgi:rSAM/selenodomain-associated transferase 2
MKLSIVIPTLNEAAILSQALKRLEVQHHEIIVVDGGSKDGTVDIARQYTPLVLISPQGRGLQQDKGARQARGDVIVFLHADTQLPIGYLRLIGRALANPSVVFGAFRLSIWPKEPALELVSLMANLRSRFLRMPYGDQALFVRRDTYIEVGGFRDWPVMEDVDLVRRLNRVGDFRLVEIPVRSSARRWKRENLVYTTLRNWSLICRYFMGASPHALARHYPHAR